MTIDIAMTMLLPILMAYSLVGETVHEWSGIAMFILFVAHHVLNKQWILNIAKGKYNMVRTVNLLVNLVLLLVMFTLPVSGIIMSKHIFTFLKLPLSVSLARTVHLLTSYWGFVLMSLHIGLHWNAMAHGMQVSRKNEKNKRSKIVGTIVLQIMLFVVVVFGIYAFHHRQIGMYMLLQNQFVFFDDAEPRVAFFMDYLSIMVLFSVIGYYVSVILKWAEKRKVYKR